MNQMDKKVAVRMDRRSSEAAEGKNRRWMIHVVRSFVRSLALTPLPDPL
jgi:hypothetical protein